MESPRWKTITPSQYEWERRGIDFIRAGLPDHDPYRAWSNFEFQSPDGAIYEVDLLVLTKRGFWLVECKAWEGRITGDAGTWTCRRDDGRQIVVDNPVFLANRKAKALSSLLKSQKTLARGQLPWLDALVFLSSDHVQCNLLGPTLNHVLLKDSEPKSPRGGILDALINRKGPGITPESRGLIDSKVARSLSQAMEQAGIRPSQRARQIGDYEMIKLLFDGAGYQDRLAKHKSFDDYFCLARQYTIAEAASEEDRVRLKRAAEREFRILKELEHQNILPVLDYKEHVNGPTLLFRYNDSAAERFDHFLAARGEQLTTEQRIDLLRQIADPIRFAHRKRVIHRALCPQSILISDVASERPRPQVHHWQVGVRESTSTSVKITQVGELIEGSSMVYLAPETLADTRMITEASDVFSLGAIAFHLFSGRPPATNLAELHNTLLQNKGLRISSVMDGAGKTLEEFIHWSTHPDVTTRIGSVDDFLALLDEVEKELTAPEESYVENDPLVAKQGDRLPGEFVVLREIGQGATAKAMLVTRDDKEFVLKIALDENHNARLHEEAEALRLLHSEFIVALEDETTMGGRAVLVLQKAGDQTLSALLALEGVPGLELLERYGDHLLSAVDSLERNGVNHRDIKPDNIGIISQTKRPNQLILFDFSSTRAPLDNILVGTEGYRDPFLLNRKPARWDVAAERFSVAVTLYEMTLGYGCRPHWGDGRSDPALTDGPLVLEADRFEPGVRDGMITFFNRALHRDVKKRYASAIEMQTAWRQIFHDAAKQKIVSSSGEEISVEVPFEKIVLETFISAVELPQHARNALDRIGINTIRDLLSHPLGDLHMMRGVGNRTRKDIVNFVVRLRERFPSEKPSKPSGADPVEQEDRFDLTALYNRLYGSTTTLLKNGDEHSHSIRQCLLEGIADDEIIVKSWPSRAEVAEHENMSPADVNKIISACRKRWEKDKYLNALKDDLYKKILQQGGVVSTAEIVDLVLLLRRPDNFDTLPEQRRKASALARAVVEMEESKTEPRFQVRRAGGKVAVACSSELADYAEQLSVVADRLATADPLVPPIRAFQELYELPQPTQPPECQPFDHVRMMNLAVSMSNSAAISSNREIYPKNMSAERSLRLGIGALSGNGEGEARTFAALSGNTEAKNGFSVKLIHERIRSRYREAEPLPGRPELDDLLKTVGLEFFWDEQDKVYKRPNGGFINTSGSSIPTRFSTGKESRHFEVTPEIADARRFEERLAFAFKEGGFLTLSVRPNQMRRADAELMKRFDVLERVSFDELFFRLLRQEAETAKVDWNVIEKADGAHRDSRDWRYLTQLTGRIKPKLISDLEQRKNHVLLIHPGLIARYNLMSIVETLRDRVGCDGYCPGIWLLVANDEQHELPMLDGCEIPLVTPNQRARIPDAWIGNLHRAYREKK